MKYFKYVTIVIFSVLLGISIYSCSDDSPSGITNNNNSNIVNSLGGIVNNITSTTRYMKALVGIDSTLYIVGHDSVGSNNVFLINMTTPPDSALVSMDELFSALIGISYSDTNTKGSYLNIAAYNSSSGNFEGMLRKSNVPPNNVFIVGDFYLLYFYSNGNVNISGVTTRIFNSDTLVTNINFAFGAGYNKVTSRLKVIRGNYSEYDLFSGEPEGASWYYGNLLSGKEKLLLTHF